MDTEARIEKMKHWVTAMYNIVMEIRWCIENKNHPNLAVREYVAGRINELDTKMFMIIQQLDPLEGERTYRVWESIGK